MLNHPTMDKLLELKLLGMAEALKRQADMPEIAKLSFDERFGLIVDAEFSDRDNARFAQRVKTAKLRQSACLEDLDFQPSRGLDRKLIAQLSNCEWVTKGLNVLITGKTGVGKSYVACALAQKACRMGLTTLYLRAPRFFQDLTVARLNGGYARLLNRLAKFELLVLDDFALVPIAEEQCRDLLEVTDDRYGRSSMIIASQLPVKSWYQMFANETLADAILDRVVHESYRLELEGETQRDPTNRRKNKTEKN
ncbi:MAG: IS21-like element helper ATPase IstB [Candidatus Obscuribacterales bacterium]